jgi:ferrous iron transport protein B
MSTTTPTVSGFTGKADFVFAMVGKPNCGKTTLFNVLTGLRQKVANYPGATVECFRGKTRGSHGELLLLVDLPGTYSLAVNSPDEAVARDVMLGLRRGTPTPDRFICVADATNLQNCLFLATQAAELGKPVILVLNMMDEARAHGISIDTQLLESELGVTVVPMQANRGVGVTELKVAMSQKNLPPARPTVPLPEAVIEAANDLAPGFEKMLGLSNSPEDMAIASNHALLWLTDTSGEIGLAALDPDLALKVAEWQQKLDEKSPLWRSEIIAARQGYTNSLIQRVVRDQKPADVSLTNRIDSVLLHPILGWISLAAVMFAIFYSIFSLAGYPMDLIDAAFSDLSSWVKETLPAGQLTNLLAEGVIAGVGGVLIFLPQILMLFFFISLLEASGYLPRIAFMLDRLFRSFGLDGRAFIPLLSSYACAIPGIMAARTIRSPLERMTTIMIAPWMSCSARLPVYMLMIAVIVAGTGASAGLTGTLIMFGAYLLGTFAALVAALILRKTRLKGTAGGFTIELPPYRWPSWLNVLLTMWDRAMIFVRKAGTIILSISIILWVLLNYPQATLPDGAPAPGSVQIENSFAGQVGKAMQPVIEPLGYDWKIGIGILASFAAREVFVGTMGIIYSVESDDDNTKPLLQALSQERWADGSPVFTPLTCLSLIVFFIFAMQCMSTLAIVQRETNSWFWPMFQLAFMTGTAYLASLLVYQVGTALGF